MVWDPDTSAAELKVAADEFDRERVEELVGQFVASLWASSRVCGEDEARRVLTQLRRKRYFELMSRAASALIETGNGTFWIRQYYAQALVDLGQLSAARAVLVDLERETGQRAATVAANAEARGLLGRLLKQEYIAAGAPHVDRNADVLGSAIARYYDVYVEKPADPRRWWHGINAVALAERARRDGIDDQSPIDAAHVAKTLLAAVTSAASKNAATPWDCAIGMEACVALGRVSDAVAWARRYVEHSDVDEFEVAGTYRQLKEVWQLRPEEAPGRELLPALEAKLLRLEGGCVPLPQRAPTAEDLEKVFEGGFVHFESYLEGIARARAVGRVGRHKTRGLGTGFLLCGGHLHPSLGDEPVFLTNAHVVSDEAGANPAVRPDDARVSFQFQGPEANEVFMTRVKEVIWESPVHKHDACLVRLAEVPAVPPCPVAPSLGSDEKRVFVIGHPAGGDLSFSMYDNRVVGHNDRLIHYRAPTEPGSSGSPVFNLDWEVVALHHAGSNHKPRLDGEGVYQANEGILMTAIIGALKDALSGVA